MGGVYFPYMGRRNPLTDWAQFFLGERYPWCNQASQIWWRSLKGFRGSCGSNFSISHWLCWSSLQHSHTTVWACDAHRRKLVPFFWLTVLKMPNYIWSCDRDNGDWWKQRQIQALRLTIVRVIKSDSDISLWTHCCFVAHSTKFFGRTISLPIRPIPPHPCFLHNFTSIGPQSSSDNK